MRRDITRRTMLRGLGTALALPMLDGMLPGTSKALGADGLGAVGEAPKRAAFVYVPNGIHLPDFWPKETGALPSEFPSILKPMEPFRNEMLVLNGLALDKARANGDGPGDHARAMAAFLTGCQPRKTHGADIEAGLSADQQIARVVGKYTRFPSLEIGIEPGRQSGNCDSGYSCAYSGSLSWKGPNTPNAKEVDPKLVFERLFGNGKDREVAESRARREAYQQSILDFVLEDAGQLKKQLGKGDQLKLDEYFTCVRELEQRIQHVQNDRDRPIVKPNMSAPDGIPREMKDHIRLMCDLMVLAFQCDLTRVVTFPFANEGSNRSYPFIGVRGGHHSLSHHGNDPEKTSQIRKINVFHMEQFAYMIGRLRSVKEGEKTLLDQCMVVYGSGNADGNRHTHHDLPILLVGGGGGYIQGGSMLRYPKETPLMNLYMAMFEIMGAPAPRFGDSTGTLKL